MKIRMSKDESYPVYNIHDVSHDWLNLAEVSASTLWRWKKAIAAYEAVQDEMQTTYQTSTYGKD